MVRSFAASKFTACLGLLGMVALLGTTAARAHPHVWITTETTVLYENGTITGLRHKWSFDDFYTSMAIQGLDTNNDGIYDREELADLAKLNMEGLKEFDYFTVARLATEQLKFEAPRDVWLEHTEAPEGAVEITVKTGDAAFEGTGVETIKPAEPAPAEGIVARLRQWVFGGANTPSTPPPGPAEKPKVLSLHFTLPLAQPVLAEAEGFNFAISDPTFFIAFEPAEKNAVSFAPGAPPSCRATIGEAEPARAPTPEEIAKSLAEPNPAADANRLGDAFSQQFGGQAVGFGFVRPIRITCGPPS